MAGTGWDKSSPNEPEKTEETLAEITHKVVIQTSGRLGAEVASRAASEAASRALGVTLEPADLTRTAPAAPAGGKDLTAAAEAAGALAIALAFYNNYRTIDIDRGDELKG